MFLTHPDVVQAVTFSLRHPTLGEDVVTAVILREGVETVEDELREFAFDSIADFKVPSKVIILDEIPKGPTGKLQRIGLEDKLAKVLEVEYLEPRNEIEKKLVELYTGVLDVEQIGVLDNFFMMGGDSLSAILLVTEIYNVFDIEINPYIIFHYPTIEKLAVYISGLKS